MINDNYGRGAINVAKRLKKLIEANQYLADIESLDALFPRLLDLAKNVTAAEASSLMLYDPKRDVLEFASVADEVIGEAGGEILKISVKLKMGEGIAGWVAENRKSLIIKDTQQDPRFSKQADKQTGFITRNLLCVPLVYNEELLGVINVLNSKEKQCFDAEDLELLESFAHLAAIAIIRSRLLETRLKQQRLQIQMEAASKIQSLFWPKLPEMETGSNVWAVSLPASFVGGDLYDLIPMTDGSWLVYVADVADKGLPAALIMVALWSRIREEALLHDEVDKLLETVNNAMHDLMAEEGFFSTIIIGRYWPATGRIQLARGGHLPPLWISKDGLGKVPELKGPSLGIVPGAKYENKEITLSPGESILFLSDGVTEAENEEVVLFGNRRLIDYIQKTNGPPWGKGLLDSVKAWQGTAKASDDLTILEIWREPA
ncbi:MAG: GAF domain-containing SpoIIE family protein phosphatase [Candidatus Desulfatibia sp.]|uniref:PP2C family protein-serine/threonine phosphatase n=1 Tax=Candidatus Desulfatibia sp. TaxID=3101189 RepID=UPI002F30CF8D